MVFVRTITFNCDLSEESVAAICTVNEIVQWSFAGCACGCQNGRSERVSVDGVADRRADGQSVLRRYGYRPAPCVDRRPLSNQYQSVPDSPLGRRSRHGVLR